MYHGIPTRNSFEGVANYHGYNIPIKIFEQQALYLKRNCNVVRLADFLADRNLSNIKMNIVITFDDGYENNYFNAFQVLARHSLPAIYALPTAFIGDRQPLWNDVIEFLVNHTRRSDAQFEWENEKHNFSIRDFGERLNLYNWLLLKCVQIAQVDRENFIDEAIDALEVIVNPEELFRNEDYRPLNETQIQEMAESPLADFASHSVHHFLLSRVDLELKRAELSISKRQVEAITQSPCRYFCVPGGMYDVELVEEAFRLGYEIVLTSDPGLAKNTGRVLNRNGLFHQPSIYWFADQIHGPTLEALAGVRRVREMIRSRFKYRSSMGQ